MLNRPLWVIWLFLLGCAQNPHSSSPSSNSPSSDQGRSGMSRELLKSGQDYQVRRVAKKAQGQLSVDHDQTRQEVYNVHECTFGYEKGQGRVHRNDRPYQFETISVSVMGRSPSGEDFFDRVSYTNADYTKTFVEWDFSRSFGPIDLDSTLRFGHDDIQGALWFTRGSGKPVMELRHTDTYATARSHYFRPGEKRDYTIRIYFDQIDDAAVKLNSIELLVMSSRRDRFGNYKKAEKVTHVTCTQFEEA